MRDVLDPVLGFVDQNDPGGVVGLYLYGSAVLGGLRADSDVDLLLITSRSLDHTERQGLTAVLLATSGWKGHATTFPHVTHRRPIELTSVVLDELNDVTLQTRRDFQYGEWLRAEATAGSVSHPTVDPDVVVLLATARTRHQALRGPQLAAVVPGIHPDTLRRAVQANLAQITDDLEGDERNTLLALARSVVTLSTGQIVSKDEAVDIVAPLLADADRQLLERAKAEYLGQGTDRGDEPAWEVSGVVAALSEIIRAGGVDGSRLRVGPPR